MGTTMGEGGAARSRSTGSRARCCIRATTATTRPAGLQRDDRPQAGGHRPLRVDRRRRRGRRPGPRQRPAALGLRRRARRHRLRGRRRRHVPRPARACVRSRSIPQPRTAAGRRRRHLGRGRRRDAGARARRHRRPRVDHRRRRASRSAAAAAGSSARSASCATTCSRPRSSPPTAASSSRPRRRTPSSSGACAAAAATSASSPRSRSGSTRSVRSCSAGMLMYPGSRRAASCCASTATSWRRRPTRSAPASRSSPHRRRTSCPSRCGASRSSASSCCYAGPVEDGEAALRPLRELPTSASTWSAPMPYVAVQQLLDAAEPEGHAELLDGRLLRRPARRGDRRARRARHQAGVAADADHRRAGRRRGRPGRRGRHRLRAAQRAAGTSTTCRCGPTPPTPRRTSPTRATIAAAMKPWTTGRAYLNFIGDEGRRPGRGGLRRREVRAASPTQATSGTRRTSSATTRTSRRAPRRDVNTESPNTPSSSSRRNTDGRPAPPSRPASPRVATCSRSYFFDQPSSSVQGIRGRVAAPPRTSTDPNWHWTARKR